jgi:hypothetical protein
LPFTKFLVLAFLQSVVGLLKRRKHEQQAWLLKEFSGGSRNIRFRQSALCPRYGYVSRDAGYADERKER